MVILVVKKLEQFIEKTMNVKQTQSLISQGGKPPDNEYLQQKQQELDSLMRQTFDLKKKIKVVRTDLERDINFKRMVESENIAKEQYRRLQQLLDDNMQLKKIHGSQEAMLDQREEKKAKREEILLLKEEIAKLNASLRHSEKKGRERDKKLQDRHEQVIEYQDRIRQMQEVLRLKKQSAKKHLEVHNGRIQASEQDFTLSQTAN